MRVQVTFYNLYLRLAVYSLPCLSFVLSLAVCSAASSTFAHAFSSHEYLRLLVLLSMTWYIAAERMRIASVSELFVEEFGLKRVMIACVIAYGSSISAIYLGRLGNFSRGFLATTAASLFFSTAVVRWLFRYALSNQRRNHRVLVIGADAFARRVACRLTRGPVLHTVVVAHVQLPGQSVQLKHTKVLSFDDVDHLEVNPGIDDIVIALSPSDYGQLSAILPRLKRLSVPIRMAVDFGPNVIMREKLFQLGRLNMVDLGTTPAECHKYLFLKRGFDIVFSACVLMFLSPLLLLITAGIKLTSPGPVLFIQQRVGLNGKLFPMLKFRTMRAAPANESDTKWTTSSDPRRTAFGMFLRKTSLDELPQFFNVLRGDMSVVGPRPERPYFVRKFCESYVGYGSRHRLKVGITGWAQVNGLRGDTSISKRIEYDLFYLSNWSFRFDLKIIARTVLSGLISKNAY